MDIFSFEWGSIVFSRTKNPENIVILFDSKTCTTDSSVSELGAKP